MIMSKSTRRIPALAAAAFGLSAALIAIGAFAQETTKPAPPAQPRIERPGPLADLNLTPDQVKALEGFRRARREQARAFRDDMAKLRDEMRGLRADPDANEAKIEALIDKRAALMAAHEKDALRARAERNKIFTPEQLEKLKTLRSRFPGRAGRAMMAGGRRGLAGRAMMRSRGRAAYRRWLRHPPWRW
jgi:Spy/CpxP family protein refolding chaperone